MDGRHITARAFHHSEELAHWRVGDGGASAWFDTPDLATGLRFALSAAALSECVDHPPDIDARSMGVMVRLNTFRPGPDGLSTLDVAAARAISEAAREQGLVADPSRITSLVLNIGSTDPAAIVPFWSAVLGLDEVDGELNDSLARQPVVCFQHLKQPRPGHGRIHVDVWFPTTRPRTCLGHARRRRTADQRRAGTIVVDPGRSGRQRSLCCDVDRY